MIYVTSKLSSQIIARQSQQELPLKHCKMVLNTIAYSEEYGSFCIKYIMYLDSQ